MNASWSRPRPLRPIWVCAFFVLAAFGGLLTAGGQDAAPAAPRVLLAQIDGVIGPANARFVSQAVAAAEEADADALVLQLNTPGGLVTSMRGIITDILEAEVPVIGYVAPQGGHAASAGTYILYATHLAAMAPGTNIGAATPVQMGGPPSLPDLPGEEEPEPEPDPTPSPEATDAASGDDEAGEDPVSAEPAASEETGDRDEPAPPPPGDALSAKAVNDAVAYIRSLAEQRGRNADWAEKAVRGAASITPSEALALNVIEIVAEDLDDLLAQADARIVSLQGEDATLSTAGAVVETVEPTVITRILGALANPNVAFIFMLVGVYGLIFELAQPGSVGPGVIGVISLIIGLYALNQLPLNYAGAALIVLGIAFMVVEAFTPTFGIFGFGGLVAFLIGAAMLFDTDIPEYRLSWVVIGVTAATSAGVLVLMLGAVLRSLGRPVATGLSRMIGEEARVMDWADGTGHAFAEGERWSAVGVGELEPGQAAYITEVEGLTLTLSADPPKKRRL